MLQIIRDRVFPSEARPSFLWNSQPGALFHLPSATGGSEHQPFYYSLLGKTTLAALRTWRSALSGDNLQFPCVGCCLLPVVSAEMCRMSIKLAPPRL